jgi:hypothetical protein
MVKVHYEVNNEKSVLPLTDCLCEKVPFPKLTNDWNKVTCKYCLRLRESVSDNDKRRMKK